MDYNFTQDHVSGLLEDYFGGCGLAKSPLAGLALAYYDVKILLEKQTVKFIILLPLQQG
jgi:hypothetical protein